MARNFRRYLGRHLKRSVAEMIHKAATLKIRGGVERDSQGKKAGKGALIQWEKSATLGVSQDQTLFVWKGTDTDHPTRVTDTE